MYHGFDAEGIVCLYTALGYSLVFFSLSYPAFHTGLSKGNACGVLRPCRAAHNPDRGCLLITPYKRSAVRGKKTQNSTECSIKRKTKLCFHSTPTGSYNKGYIASINM
jgi:hypothetical protein